MIPDANTIQALGEVRYDPCIAVLAPWDGTPGLPEPGALDPDVGPIDWLADNRAKGISAVAAVTVHADAGFSREACSEPDHEVVRRLVEAADLRAAPVAGQVQVHRWRYARPTVLHPDRCLVAEHPYGAAGPLVFAGDAFGGPKVEGAFLSGAAAAGALLDR